MDIDMMKSSISTDQDHMDIMKMMMQMEKQLPDQFCNSSTSDPFQGSINPTSPDQIHFSNTSPIYPNPNISSPLINTFMTLPISNNMMATTSNNNNNFKYPTSPFNNNNNNNANNSFADKKDSMAAMREMIFQIAAMQPIHIDPESVKPPKRRNVKISKDPQSVAARHRRERISEKIRILQRLVPGGTKMDTASMLDEAIHYVKFLKRQVQSLEQAAVNRPIGSNVGFPGAAAAAMSNVGYSSLVKSCQSSHHLHHHQVVGNMQMLR